MRRHAPARLVAATLLLMAGTALPSGSVDTSKLRHRKATALAFDIATGERKWRTEVSAQRGSLFLHGATDNFVYGITSSCFDDDGPFTPELVALDAKDGDVEWRVPALYPRVASAFSGSIAVMDVSGRTLTYIDTRTGEAMWTTQIPANLDPVRGTDRVLLLRSDPLTRVDPNDPEAAELVALDRRTGEQMWTYDTDPDALLATTIAGDDTLVLELRNFRDEGSRPEELRALDLGTGEQLWSAPRTDYPGQLAFAEERFFRAHVEQPGGVTAYDVHDAHVLWVTPLRASFLVAASQDVLVVKLADANQFVGLDAETGQVEWRAASDHGLALGGHGHLLLTETRPRGIDGLESEISLRDLRTGKVRWRKEMPLGAFPAIVGNDVYASLGCRSGDEY
jgi:outer membrane protein assembly factor BamB